MLLSVSSGSLSFYEAKYRFFLLPAPNLNFSEYFAKNWLSVLNLRCSFAIEAAAAAYFDESLFSIFFFSFFLGAGTALKVICFIYFSFSCSSISFLTCINAKLNENPPERFPPLDSKPWSSFLNISIFLSDSRDLKSYNVFSLFSKILGVSFTLRLFHLNILSYSFSSISINLYTSACIF